MWPSGDEIVVRRMFRGRVRGAHGATVVSDHRELTVLWVPRGTRKKAPDGDAFGGRELRGDTFEEAGALGLLPAGRGHSILIGRHDDGSLRGWYVNLERRRRTRAGIDVDDHFLDLWTYPDGTWAWEDEDELEQAVERGLIAAETAAAARREGECVLAEWPFPAGWEEWRPPPDWTPPDLPEGWDVV